MNIYELECGYIRHFVAATSENDEGDETSAYAKGTNPELYPDIHFLPFTIRLVEVEGHTITVKADYLKPKGDRYEGTYDVANMDRDQLKQWLTDKNIEFTPQWGVDKLRELAMQNV